MVATKRRFDANLQKVRIVEARRSEARLRLHALPQGRQGHQGRSGPAAAAAVGRSEPPPLPRRRRGARSRELEARREEVNDLNVFPVADGDTGRQHGAHAARRARRARPPVRRRATIDEIGRDEIVDSVARAALLGARGNSGVILSQLIRGAAEELISRPGELVDPVLIGAAMARAADRAYGSVREPAEGTILTVVREMAAPRRDARSRTWTSRGCSTASTTTRQNAMIADVLERALDAGQAVGQARPRAAADPARGGRRRRRRLRPDGHLRRRDRRAARRRAAAARAPRAGARHAPAARVLDLPLLHELRRHRRGPRRRRRGSRALERSATPCSSSATRTRSRSTSTPTSPSARPRCSTAPARSRASTSPTCTSRSPQRTERARARPIDACGVLAVVAGDGHARAVRGRSARVALDGGADAEPVDLRAAGRHPRGARRGGRRAAELAERGHGRRARRRAVGEDRPRRAVALDAGRASPPPSRSTRPRRAPTTPPRWSEALAPRAHRRASPRPRATTPRRRFRRGDAVGFVDEELVAWGEPARDARGRARRARPRGRAADADRGRRRAAGRRRASPASRPDGVELEYSRGGQPAYWWLIAAE